MKRVQEYHIILHIHIAVLWVSLMLREYFGSILILLMTLLWLLAYLIEVKRENQNGK